MGKKYQLTDDTITLGIRVLHRIIAVRDFDNVKKGTLGGYIESESNLSHDGKAWVSGDARVYDSARVYGEAWVSGKAEVYGSARVYDSAWVYGEAWVSGKAEVYGSARVYDSAWVYGEAWVSGSAEVCGTARVYGKAEVYGEAEVSGDARVSGEAQVSGSARVSGEADYIVFKNFWSSGRYFTWTRSDDMWTVGCFHGTGEELIAKAYKDSEKSGRNYERVVRYVETLKNEEFNK